MATTQHIRIFKTALKFSIDILHLHSVTSTVLSLLTGFQEMKRQGKKKEATKTQKDACLNPKSMHSKREVNTTFHVCTFANIKMGQNKGFDFHY